MPTSVDITANKVNRNDGLKDFGNMVKGPFFRNLAIPKDADNTLSMYVTRKAESQIPMPLWSI